MTEVLLAVALMGANCAPVQVRHIQPVKRVAVKRVAAKNNKQVHVVKQQVQRHQSNFVDPNYINNEYYGANQRYNSGILYLAGQNLQTELIVKEAVREAVRGGVKDGVTLGVAEAMKLLKQELLQGRQCPAPAPPPPPVPDPKEPDFFGEPVIKEEDSLPSVSINNTCIRCHEGKNGAPQYTDGIGRLQAHKAALAIMDGEMPKGRTLSEEEKAILIHEFYSRAQ